MEPVPVPEADVYQVRLEVFEGPMDLLLFLIRKKQIDITDIPISAITREYLSYLARKEQINLDREAEFLLMAALLISIKSQLLLPREQPPADEEDPRRPLVDRLLEYERMKSASLLLREKEEAQLQTWRRMSPPPIDVADEPGLIEVSLFDLAESFFLLLKRRESENFQYLKGKDVSLDEKMRDIIRELEEKHYLDFLEFLARQESLEEALIAFFCLLELIKAGAVIAVQERLFHTIKVWMRRSRSFPENHGQPA
ncbi:MAG: segregation/condensation protein A [Candidatus Aminicenantes bacterium]|nr:segregation/condensation protein A [Candidatus Aminicenantes bacterium]